MRRPCSGFHLPRPLTGARCCIGLPPRAAAAGCLFRSRTTAGKSISPICMAEPCLKTSRTSSHLPGRCERRRFMPRSRTPYPSAQFSVSYFRAAFAGASRRLSAFQIVSCRSATRSAASIRQSGQGMSVAAQEVGVLRRLIEARTSNADPSQGASAVFLRGGSGLSRLRHGRRRRAISSLRRHAGNARMISTSG